VIDFLKGKVLFRYLDSVSLLCGPVAFRVFVPLSLLTRAKEGEELEVFTEVVIPPEGTPSLYGFGSREERELFRNLTKIPKVGSKVALSILSHFSPEELKAILSAGDSAELSKVPGIGKKLSQRIVLELKGKMEEKAEIPEELMEVLTSLGYSRKEIFSALKGLDLKGLDLQEAVRESLKRLSGRGK